MSDILLEKINETDLEEALRLVDRGLGDMMHRELVSTDEVSDLLLDVRQILTGVKAAQPV